MRISFGDFDLQVAGGHVVGFQPIQDHLAELAASQVAGCDVDGDTGEVGSQPGTPSGGLLHGVGQHHLVDRDQQPGLLGHCEEQRWQL